MSIKEKWLIKLFQENLRFLMNVRDMNQTDLAAKLGVSKTQISKLLQPDANPTLDKILDISRILEVRPDLLIYVSTDSWAHFLEKNEDISIDSVDSIQKAMDHFHSARNMAKMDEEEKAERVAASRKKSKKK